MFLFSTSDWFDSIERTIFNIFPNSQIIFTSIKVKDIADLIEQLNIVENIHEWAHRNTKNNYEEAKRIYFWPSMKKDFIKWVRECKICKTQKYERILTKQQVGSTPIPTAVGESISMDLFYIDNKQYVTSVDRYSKYLIVHPILTK